MRRCRKGIVNNQSWEFLNLTRKHLQSHRSSQLICVLRSGQRAEQRAEPLRPEPSAVGTDTCAAARSVARALLGFPWLDPAAAHAGAADLFSFLLRRRSARTVGAVTGGVHPPAEAKDKAFSVALGTGPLVLVGVSYLRRGASWQVQLHGLLDKVRLVMVPNSRLLGRVLSLLFSRCSDLTAVTPVKAPSENWKTCSRSH